MTIEGVDYAWDRPDPAGLYAAGKRFVLRYLSYNTTGKNLTVAERDRLWAAGLAIVLNWENRGNDHTDGFAGGARNAVKARELATALGAPKDQPIYFSIDSDTSANPSVIDAYLRGIASVEPLECIGVYGGYATVKRAHEQGLATWLWQTYGWSGGRWYPGVHLQQYRNGVTVAGADTDLNRAMVADYGQWTGDDMALTSQDAKLVAQYVWHDDTQMPAGVGDKRESGGTSVLRTRDAAEPTRKAVDALTADMAAVKASLARIEAALAGAGSATGGGATPAQVEEIVHDELGKLEITVKD